MKIAFRASPRPRAQRALKELSARYGQTPAAEADFIVTIGGDGTALEALHEALAMPAKPVFAHAYRQLHRNSLQFTTDA
ncbi:hypothetical protein U8C35_29210 (plasmid) [Sinorhizobium medicae]|uniref:hypothetical protein n=1 Tax=Sinorhizobium medicae TaxID=110321 RepID=UPI002AF6AFB0|nr:hypothetical protein [Sinorhizobium medicae]WQO62186.1 hypothetical protein U8C35_29210 [Sinorhizobium medicae]